MPRIPVLVLSLMLGAACAWLVSCGGGSRDTTHLLPGASANQLAANLDTVQQYASQGDCASAAQAAAEGLAAVQALPAKVDPDLKQALEQGFDRLQVLAENPHKCSPTQTTTATTTETTTATTATTQTTTPTTTTHAPPPPPPTHTTTTPPPTTPSGGGGGGTGGGGTGGGTTP